MAYGYGVGYGNSNGFNTLGNNNNIMSPNALNTLQGSWTQPNEFNSFNSLNPQSNPSQQQGLFGLNQGEWGNVGMLGTGLQGAFNAWATFNQLSLARKQYGLAKDSYEYNKNLNTKNYNMQVEDRINGRYSDREKTQAEKDQMIKDKQI